MISTAQRGEDAWISMYLNPPKKGIFVDVGAAHPSVNSNTYWFEKLGWTGLAIDANPKWKDQWVHLRPGTQWVQAIVGRDGAMEWFDTNPIDEISSIKESSEFGYSAKTYSLDTLLAEYKIGHIDLLSIDVEGYEDVVLMGLDLNKHQPRIIIVEYNTLGKYNFEAIEYLVLNGYKIRHLTEFNFILTREIW